MKNEPLKMEFGIFVEKSTLRCSFFVQKSETAVSYDKYFTKFCKLKQFCCKINKTYKMAI